MPRYLVIPLEDLQYMPGQYDQYLNGLPVVYEPGLARTARQVDVEDQYAPSGYDEPAPAGSSAYAAPHGSVGPDHVDYGAYTGGYGAFGWYSDHPVLLGAHH
jgi:hypothetical protein